MSVRDFEDDLFSTMAKFVVAAFLILILAALAGCTKTHILCVPDQHNHEACHD